MRVMMRIHIPVEKGNSAIADGHLPKVIQAFAEMAKPECMYFGTSNGERTMIAVFDMVSPTDSRASPSPSPPRSTQQKETTTSTT